MLRRLGVRTAERGRFGFFVLLATGVAIAQMLGQAGSEALFLARLGAERLPMAFVAASASTVGATLLYALRVGRARNDRVFVELLAIGALLVGLLSGAAHAGSTGALVALYCLYFATQAVFLSHFWTLVGDFFDTLAAKRLVPLFTVGLSLGGAVGGAAAIGVVSLGSAEALLVGWGSVLAATALGVVVSGGRLQRWRTLAGGEEDETSVAGIRAAMRYLRGSPLGRWLVASALAMVLALFVAQYLYSARIVAAFPDEAELARFLAVYLTATNGIEIAIVLFVTPWAIRRLGVPAANLIHPTTTIAGALLLLGVPGLGAAVGARVNRELLDNALAAPVRGLAMNALPLRFRARVRAFLEGIVVYSGMSLAGGVLIAAEALSPAQIAGAGVLLAALYLLANLGVRRQYLAAIVTELRAGRLDLREIEAEVGAREVESLAAQFAHLARSEGREPSTALLELPRLLVSHGQAAAVREAAAEAGPLLRAACLTALGGSRQDAAVWHAALEEPDASVRVAALRAFPDSAGADAGFAAALRSCLDDPEPQVRAEAARRLEREGEAVFAALLADARPESVVAALAALPPALAGGARAHLDAADPRVRAAALGALARAPQEAPVALERLDAALADRDPSVSCAALRALAVRAEPEAVDRLVAALRHPLREARSEAIRALAARGDAGAHAARAALVAPEESAVGAALRVLGAVGSPAARGWLRGEYAARVRESVATLQCARVLSTSEVPHRFAAVAAGDALSRALRLAWRALARLEDERVVRSAERNLRGGVAPRTRASALEVLSQLGDREASRRLVLLLEPIPIEEKLQALASIERGPADVAAALARARVLSSPWLQLAAGDPSPDEEALMDRLLSLRQVSLFSRMSLERLHAIERITEESEYVKGEVIVREGDVGDDLFCIVEGEVEVLRGAGSAEQVSLNRLRAGEYFGEMAVLDGSRRSATIVATCRVRVLRLEGERLRELVNEMPELAFDLLKVLVARLRQVEERLTTG